MLTTYSQSFKTWVFAKNAEEPEVPVGQLLDFVINPDSGHFEALWIRTPEGNKLLAPRDILSWNDHEITISDAGEILTLRDFPRIESMLDSEISILEASVFQNPGRQYMGKVMDFGFDTISPKLLSLRVKSRVWIFGEEKIITREAIEEMTTEGIFITAPTAKISSEKVCKNPAADLKKAGADCRNNLKER